MKKNILFLALSVFWGLSFSQSNSCVSAPNNLISWWAAEENANDLIGSNHGTANGVSYTAVKVDKAFSFDGVNDVVDVPSNNNLDITGDVTVEFWAVQTVFNPENTVVCKGAKNEPIVFSMYFSGATFNCAFQDTNTAMVEIGGPSFEDFQWHHYAYVRQGNQHIIYADGFDFGWRTFTNLPASSAGLPLTIGAQYDKQNDNYINFFGGGVDEVGVYNRALSGAEIQSIYNAGSSGKCQYGLSVNGEIASKNEIKVYPNPAHDSFTLELNQNSFGNYENMKLEIYDLLGRSTKIVKTLNSFKTATDISQLKSGLYFYRLNSNQGLLFSGKIIKE